MDYSKATEFESCSVILRGIIDYLEETCGGDTSLNANQKAMIADVESYIESQARLKRKLLQIGIALSAERNIDALLEMIVAEAMDFTNADGGTLYIISPDEQSLIFKIVRTNSLKIKKGGLSGDPLPFNPVPLYKADGTRNIQNVSSYVALTGETINLPDVYEVEGFDFKGTREYDKKYNYRSCSMLVTPLKNHEREIIGVLQLINATGRNGNTIQFSTDYQFLIEAMASQAAIAITNTTLIRELKDLLNSFVKVIATAIDQKSPYTGGHMRRVAELTLDMAMGLCNSEDNKWENFSLTPDEYEELKIASWMHDIGKITTPDQVFDKCTKLETFYDRINAVTMKLEIFKRDIEIKYLKKKAELEAEHGGNGHSALQRLDEDFTRRLSEIDDDVEFLKKVNIGGEFVSDDKIERLQKVASYKIAIGGKTEALLNDDELINLCIRRGTLTDAERKKMNEHVEVTYKMLSQLPWPKKMKHIPIYACQHHEKLDGTGYPNAVPAERLSTQSRIMAIADIFEALTAADRPYRPGKKLSECVTILGFMVRDKHIDKELVDFFITSGLMEHYAKKEMKDYQLDDFVYNGKEYKVQ
ncbi:MAG: GAF domain-containing protein [Nitrospirae bacterium]|nr:GAF domain-containing protein [Nitrospirota bacterium]